MRMSLSNAGSYIPAAIPAVRAEVAYTPAGRSYSSPAAILQSPGSIAVNNTSLASGA